MGTPDYAVPTLRALATRHDVACAYSQPPRKAGRRGLKLTPSPVHATAQELGIEVRTPLSLKVEEEQSAFAALEADVAIVVAYGLILPQAILDAPCVDSLNGHASLLPRWRGAAPIQRAIMAGDTETGVCVMRMEAGLDTGPVAMREAVPITDATTAGQLHDRLADLTARLMLRAVDELEDLVFEPQSEEGVTYARKIEKGETRIDWSRPAEAVARHVMGLSPFPGAWFDHDGDRVKVLRATSERGSGDPGVVLDDALLIACGKSAVRLLDVQRAGSRAMSAEEFQRGKSIVAGIRLS